MSGPVIICEAHKRDFTFSFIFDGMKMIMSPTMSIFGDIAGLK